MSGALNMSKPPKDGNMLRNYLKGIIKDAYNEFMYNNKTERQKEIEKRKRYKAGVHDKQLKVKHNVDDNVTLNFTGLLIDRATSLLMGSFSEFDIDEESKEAEYIASVYQANNQIELLHGVSDYGALVGTCAIKIMPNDDDVPELHAIDPETLEIITDDENVRRVIGYSISYIVERIGGDGRARKLRRQQVIELVAGSEGEDGVFIPGFGWLIRDYLQDRDGKMREMENSPTEWDYEFPPIVHWKNLPNAGSPYGRADLTNDIIVIQDGINRTVSNANKVMRLQAHQRLWGRLFGKADAVDMGVDRILMSANPEAHLDHIPANGDLGGMRAFAEMLRDAMFSISRSADPATLKDKVGQLTNFGLRVMYKDTLDKLDTKRALYGEALEELNRRLLVIEGLNPDKAGEVVWKNPLPENEKEESDTLIQDMDAKLVSRQTAQSLRGYDSEKEQKRIAEESVTDQNIGGAIIDNFLKGN